MLDRTSLEAKLNSSRQQHLLEHWDRLTIDQQQRLSAQIESLDLPAIMQVVSDSAAAKEPDWQRQPESVGPPPAIRLGDEAEDTVARTKGEESLRRGEVALLIVAGGQGSRLGFDHPKGLFPIGAVSGRTLFQVLVDQLLAVQSACECRIPVYIMTSPATHDETVEYFAANRFLGLSEEQLHIFCQGTMPAFDLATQRILLGSPDSLALSPDGHGGMLPALASSGGLSRAVEENVKMFFYCQIDNPLVPVCHPVWLGHHLQHQSELTTIAVEKREPNERVGNVVRVGERVEIIEYSEFDKLPEEFSAARDDAGRLKLWAGNIAVHVMGVDFLQRMVSHGASLPLHRAAKKVEHYCPETDQTIQPTDINALKLERFIFDLLPLASRSLVIECDQASCFAPVKNSPSDPFDNPQTAQAAMVARDTQRLVAAGISVRPGCAVEINPRWLTMDDASSSDCPPVTKPTYWNEIGERQERD